MKIVATKQEIESEILPWHDHVSVVFKSLFLIPASAIVLLFYTLVELITLPNKVIRNLTLQVIVQKIINRKGT